MTTVTDADREAAADHFGMTNDALRADFARSGKYDLSVCVQAFARHREAEVAKIVAWLRGNFGSWNVEATNAKKFADAIQRGEYKETNK